MSRAASVRNVGGESSDLPALPGGYFGKSQLPLASLVFLLPFVILYEAGTRYFATDVHHHTEQRIFAFHLMQLFFQWFGATGRYLPAMAVCTILLTCHILRHDPWEIDLSTPFFMLVESIAWALPLMVLDALTTYYVPLGPPHGRWPTMLVMSIGAGVYEELVFRLAVVAVLSILLVDLCKISKGWSTPLIVLGTAVLFADYHYWGGMETFAWRTFVFRTVAGIYFSLLFFSRGFGVTAGAHAAYDLIAVTRMALIGV
jgi:hypothetical protein